MEPAGYKGRESQNVRLQVDHSTAANGGRRGDSKVLYLKHDCHHLKGRREEESSKGGQTMKERREEGSNGGRQ